MKQRSSSPWSRREFLGIPVAAALGAPWISGAQSVPGPGFIHRALNGWITDLATEPDPDAAWPSMRLDEGLLQDYRETFALMRRVGFNEIVTLIPG